MHERVDGLQAERGRMRDDGAARIKDFPAGFRSRRADVACQILGAEDQGVEPIAGGGNLSEVDDAARGFDDAPAGECSSRQWLRSIHWICSACSTLGSMRLSGR